MGTVHPLRPRPEIGRVLWRAAILLGIGDDDTVDTVAESEHFSARAARVWIEERLPHAQLPDWVAHRPHGEAGAYLFGQIERGMYTIQGEHGIAWEPDPDAPLWDAYLVRGVVRWRGW